MLSLSGPHLGAAFLGGLIGAGMWLMARWHRSTSLSQLAMADARNPRESFIFKLSKAPCFELFSNVILVALPLDKYVSSASALLHTTSKLESDSLGPVYREMLHNLLNPIQHSDRVKFVRIVITASSAGKGINGLIGRSAHIALLENEVFVRKLMAGLLRYFV